VLGATRGARTTVSIEIGVVVACSDFSKAQTAIGRDSLDKGSRSRDIWYFQHRFHAFVFQLGEVLTRFRLAFFSFVICRTLRVDTRDLRKYRNWPADNRPCTYSAPHAV
jgi:hypothetical protein